jgi:hypothetical protein
MEEREIEREKAGDNYYKSGLLMKTMRVLRVRSRVRRGVKMLDRTMRRSIWVQL